MTHDSLETIITRILEEILHLIEIYNFGWLLHWSCKIDLRNKINK